MIEMDYIATESDWNPAIAYSAHREAEATEAEAAHLDGMMEQNAGKKFAEECIVKVGDTHLPLRIHIGNLRGRSQVLRQEVSEFGGYRAVQSFMQGS